MSRIMKCRHCDEPLVCAACGKRQTPERTRKRATTVRLPPELEEELRRQAEEEGVSFSALVARLINRSESDLDTVSHRKRKAS